MRGCRTCEGASVIQKNFNDLDKINSVFLCAEVPIVDEHRPQQRPRRREGPPWHSAEIGAHLDAFLPFTRLAELARRSSRDRRPARLAAHLIRRGPLAGALGTAVGPAHDGDAQRRSTCSPTTPSNGLDGAGVRAVVSEERRAGRADADGKFLVAIDPLDGSSNIEVNITIGTRVLGARRADRREVAAAISCSPGASSAPPASCSTGRIPLSCSPPAPGRTWPRSIPRATRFRITKLHLRIPEERNEFAINTSNSRHWPAPVRAYVDDCLRAPRARAARISTCAGSARWWPTSIACCMRGGVYLYPGDRAARLRQGPAASALRGQPVALLIEQAGGVGDRRRQSHPRRRADDLHARTPLIFGSTDKVERVARLLPRRPPLARRARRCSAPRSLRGNVRMGRHDVGQTSHHRDHRLLRRRHDLGQA